MLNDIIIGTNSIRVVTNSKTADIYLAPVTPVSNITSIFIEDNSITSTSGSIYVSSYPLGIDLFNRKLGLLCKVDLSSSGTSNFTSAIESNLRRIVPISGSKQIG